METKKCPECLTDIPADAKRCAQCRHRFLDPAQKLVRTIVVILLAILAFAAIKSFYDNRRADAERQGRQELCREMRVGC